MNIAFTPNKYSELLTRDGLDCLPPPAIKLLKDEVKQIDENANISEDNTGLGADWIWILIGLTYTAIERGDKINKGIEGWLKIGKRIKKFLQKFKQHRIDIDIATVLGIEKIAIAEKRIISIEILFKHQNIIKSNIGFFNKQHDDLMTITNAYYLIGYKINDSKLYVIGSTISGEIEILKSLEL